MLFNCVKIAIMLIIFFPQNGMASCVGGQLHCNLKNNKEVYNCSDVSNLNVISESSYTIGGVNITNADDKNELFDFLKLTISGVCGGAVTMFGTYVTLHSIEKFKAKKDRDFKLINWREAYWNIFSKYANGEISSDDLRFPESVDLDFIAYKLVLSAKEEILDNGLHSSDKFLDRNLAKQKAMKIVDRHFSLSE